MRLPYADPNTLTSETDLQTLTQIKTRRGPRGLLPLDLALLHTPPIASGWNSLLGAVRTQTSLTSSIREIAICRVALLNKAWFEWRQHLPLLADSESFKADDRKLEVVMEVDPTGRGNLSEGEWVVLRVADAMTRDVAVSDGLFDEMKGLFSVQEVNEIVLTVATYNMVSRYLRVLDVGEANESPPEFVAKVVNPMESDGVIQS